jgi:hypothetical protein
MEMKMIEILKVLALSSLLITFSANSAEVDVTFNSSGDFVDSFFLQTNSSSDTIVIDYIDLAIEVSGMVLQAAFDGFTDNEFNQAGSTWALYLDVNDDLEATADVLIASGGIFDNQYQFSELIDEGNYYFKLVSDLGTIDAQGAKTEYELTLTQMPLPAAFWLFGSALVAFLGFGRRNAA